MKHFVLLILLWVTGVMAQEEARLLRFPAIHGQQLVFVYAGDLYTVASEGGIARRLTSHVGFESFPRFSPDGRTLAFTGQYDGNTEVYTMPAEGGTPRRLTFTATLGRDDIADRMGPNNIVMGWTPDGEKIVFRSRMREPNDFIGQLYTVSREGDLPQQLPLPRGGFCSYSPDGRQFVYNRVFREFRTWKRYRGGMADDLWLYDFATQKTENLTDHPAQDIFPMWQGNRIYFLSDRDENKRMNLYVLELEGREVRQLTRFVDFDIKFPSLGANAIVFENGGYIYRFDLATEQKHRVPVTIANDQITRRGGLEDVSESVRYGDLSPQGNRVLLGARGEVFSVPAKEGISYNYTFTPGVHERNCAWSPDGRWIAYISDRSGENEITIRRADREGEEIQLTRNSDTYIFDLAWSPDSRRILFSDKKLRLSWVDVVSKQVEQVAQAEAWEIRDYNWSPDSKWIAYTRPEREGMNKICLYHLDSKQTIEATDGWYDASSPVFSSDGTFLFFVSDRDFNPSWNAVEWNYTYQDMQRIYLLALAKDTPSPFALKNDSVAVRSEKPQAKGQKEQGKKDEPAEKPVSVRIDVEGLRDRIVALPIKPAVYSGLISIGDNLYYRRKASSDEKPLLCLYQFKDKKESELGSIGGYTVSADQKKMLVMENKKFAVIDVPTQKVEIKEYIDLSGLKVRLDREKEWAQIFDESWRQMRDFFYDPEMHGVDWPAVRERYRPMVAHVAHRADLTYIIGEMIGELNVGHAYVGGGDMPQAERIQTGLLGADLERDAATGYYRIKKILKGENWLPNRRSPLTEVGVQAGEGDYILAINGQETRDMDNIYAWLLDTPGKTIELLLNDKPVRNGAREVLVKPIADEQGLVYYNWVQGNIQKVAEATDGQVGYIHIPDMGSAGLNEFVKHFYPQLRKKGLIIDVRGNGGGNVSPQIIERLQRRVVMMDRARNAAHGPDPGALHYGPKVTLIDEFSASDGDLFPYRFRRAGLGKLIGKRTWGG
ncbi:PD40 domain-containing protein, partial [candidate division KSB1 bacterium]|nr:PD40 domain-containing protein [candidate division KSB1 bacterium]